MAVTSGLQFAPAVRFPLRDYQAEAIEAIETAWQTGTQRPLVVLPTGAGKTVVFTHLARRRATVGRTLILVHRDELVTQTVGKLAEIAPELAVGVVKASQDEHEDVDVIVASVQTLARQSRIAPIVGTIATVIVDEAHHAVADTYRLVLGELGCWREDGPKAVGVTATAGGRSDGAGMDAVWERIVFERGIIHMIVNEHLRDVTALHLTTDADLGKVSTRGGDYTDSSLGQELTESGAIESAALGYVQYAKDRRGIAFTPTIATAEELADQLRRHGIPAEMLSGKTPRDERRAILRRLHTGQTQVVTNAAVLTEGFDEPLVSCVLIARPTKARGLFVQMAGRCLRKDLRAPGVGSPEKALLLDLYAPPSAGLATIADLVGDADVTVSPKPGESLTEALARAEEEAATVEARARIRSALRAKAVRLFGGSRLRWIALDGGGWTLAAGDATLVLVPMGDEGEHFDVLASHRGGRVEPVARRLSLEYAQGISEEHARAHGLVIADANALWRRKPPSPRQLTALRSMKLPIPKTSGEASDAISAVTAGRAARKYLQGVAS